MKLLDLFIKMGYSTEYEDAEEIIMDNQHLLDKGFVEQARKNLNKLYYHTFVKDHPDINKIIEEYLNE